MSKIEWCDRSDWNPIRGCTRASEGCRNCYAEAIAARFSGPGQPWHGFAEKTASGPRWTGKVELIEDRLTLPLKWRKPAKIFTNSASDLFHESVPDEWIDRVFAVMACAAQHQFQVLTKRARRMREYMAALSADPAERLAQAVSAMGYDDDAACAVANWVNGWSRWRHAPEDDNPLDGSRVRWPLPNVWLGVTAEDQTRADERIPDLLATPAALRSVSVEPMLGPINLNSIDLPGGDEEVLPLGAKHLDRDDYDGFAKLDWVIVGGESGPNARPMHPDWARGLRDQCKAAGVPFFFKQMSGRTKAALFDIPKDLQIMDFPHA